MSDHLSGCRGGGGAVDVGEGRGCGCRGGYTLGEGTPKRSYAKLALMSS